jgi:hypothetical protein
VIARLPHVLLTVALVACPTTDPMDDDDATDDDDVAGDPWPFLTWTPFTVPGEGAIEPVEGGPDPARITTLETYLERANCSVVRAGGQDTIEESYDGSGRLIERVSADVGLAWAFDSNGDITAHSVTERPSNALLSEAQYVYENRHAVRETLTGFGGPSVDMVRTYIDDQLTQRTLDIQRDGSIDRTELFEYDGARRVADVMHEDDDGVPDGGRTYRYDQPWASPTFQDLDVNGDGTPEFAWAWTWNGDGLWVSYDDGADGSVDERWTWDARRRLIAFHGPNMDATCTWGDDDQLGTLEIDDGDPRTLVHTYADGLLVRIETTEGLDGGAVRAVETRTYEARRITSKSTDLGGNGTEDAIETWTWTCP